MKPRPRLVFFYSPTSGLCRRVDGHIAAVLQRRHRHGVFELVRVNVDERPDLAKRFGVDTVPTLVVVEERRVKRRVVAPRKAAEVKDALNDWLG